MIEASLRRFLFRTFAARMAWVGALALAAAVTEAAGLLLLIPLLETEGWNPLGLTRPLALALILTALAGQIALVRWSQILQTGLAEAVSHSLRVRIHQALLNAPWERVVRHRPSDHLHLLTDEVDRVGGATHLLVGSSVQMALGGAALGVALFVSPMATGVALLGGAALALGLWRWTREARTLGTQLSEASASLLSEASEQMQSLKVARAQGAMADHEALFVRTSESVEHTLVGAAVNQADVTLGFRLGFLALAGGVAALALGPLQMETTAAVLLLFVLARVAPRIWSLANQAQSILHMLPAFERISRQIENLEVGGRRAMEEGPLTGLDTPPEIQLREVTFQYDVDRQLPAVAGADLTLERGLMTALTGPTGAGKSTLADLVLGLLEPDSGAILVDGEPLGDLPSGWRRSVAFLPPEPFLFQGSIRENLAWGAPALPDEALMEALDQVRLGSWIRGAPAGLDTQVGPSGGLLSTGERQRMALARALVRRPRLFVLDEPTSAVDSETEQEILAALRSLRGETTILLITHREQAAQAADRIYQMEAGALTPRR